MELAGSVSLLSETAQNVQCWVPSLGLEQAAACPKEKEENLSEWKEMGCKRRMKKIEGLLVTAPQEAHIVHMPYTKSLAWAFDQAVDDAVEVVVWAATVLEKDFGSLDEANLNTERRVTV